MFHGCDIWSPTFRIPYFFALLGGSTVRQSSLFPRKPCGGGKILCFLSFSVRFSLRLPARFRSFCSRFGSDVYRFWLAVLFFFFAPGRPFSVCSGAEQGTDNSGTEIHFRLSAGPRLQVASPMKGNFSTPKECFYKKML